MWKGAISFGLVTIPVKLYAATESKDVKFNLLHQECGTPVQYRKWCPTCDRQIEAAEITRGYEFERGRYVNVTDEEVEAIPLAAKRTLEIVGFIKLEEIDPVYFEKTYYLEPGEGGAKAYALLRHAMEQTGRVAIARVVIRSKESLAALRVFQNGVLAMETMHFPDEVRSVAGLTGIVEPELRPQEVEMAISLIQSLAMDFAPEQFENQYRSALLELIQAKVQGEEIMKVEPAAEPGRVVDLMAALQASIRAAEAAKEGAPGAGEPAQRVAEEPVIPVAVPVPPAAASPPSAPASTPPIPTPQIPGLTPSPLGVAPSPPVVPDVPGAVPGVAQTPPGVAAAIPGVGQPVPGLTPPGTTPGRTPPPGQIPWSRPLTEPPPPPGR